MLRRRRPERDHKRKAALALTGISAAVFSALRLRRRRAQGGEPAADSKTIVRELFEETWMGDLGVIDRYVSQMYVGHDPSQQTPTVGIDGFKAFVQRMRDGFSNTRITIEEQIAEGDTVATRWTGRGTHTGEVSGVAATGKDVTITGTSVSRLENGKVVEDHTAWDMLGMLVQLGAIPTPGTAGQEQEHEPEYQPEHRHEPEYEHHERQHEHY